MPFKRHTDITFINAAAVIRNSDTGQSAFLYFHCYRCSSGIQAVLYQLLDCCSGSLHNFACSNFSNQGFTERSDFSHTNLLFKHRSKAAAVSLLSQIFRAFSRRRKSVFMASIGVMAITSISCSSLMISSFLYSNRSICSFFRTVLSSPRIF